MAGEHSHNGRTEGKNLLTGDPYPNNAGKSEDQESFLRGIYVKASIMEYDRLEAERVRLNQRRLWRRNCIQVALAAVSLAAGYFVLRHYAFDPGSVFTLSVILIGLGAAVEQIGIRE